VSTDAKLFRDLEERLFKSEVRNSTGEIGRLLADEFVEVGSYGGVFTKRDIIDALEDEPTMERTLKDFRVERLASGAALVTYRSIRRAAGDPIVRHFLRTSIWKRMDGRWRMVFH